MKRTFDQQRTQPALNGSQPAQSVSAPSTPRPDQNAPALDAAYANYGYGPRHPSHELNRQAEAQAAAAQHAQHLAAQAQAAQQQQAILAQQAAQAYQQSQMRNASGMTPLYPSYTPGYQHFPSQSQPAQPPMGQLTPPSKRPRYDSNNGAPMPPVPASLPPPMPPIQNAVRPVVDPSRGGPPPSQGRRNVFPPPYAGPSGPPGPPFMPGQPFPMQGFPPHSPGFSNGYGPPPMTGPMRGGPPGRGMPPMHDRGGPPRGMRGGPPMQPHRGMPLPPRGQSQRGRARDRGRMRQTKGRQTQQEATRRAFSDFRIVSIEIEELEWSWEGEPYTREPSAAVPVEEAQARGKHKREEDSEDEREAAKKARADREDPADGADARQSPETPASLPAKSPVLPTEEPAALPDEPDRQQERPWQDAAHAAATEQDEEDSIDGVPAEGSERPVSPSPSVASTVGKTRKSGTNVRESNRLRIYFAAPAEPAKQPRRPPIPTRPTSAEQGDEDGEAAEPAASELPADLQAAAEAASTEAGPSSKPIEEAAPVSVASETPHASPDRLSISYAKNTRRMIIDAAIIETLRLHRAEHRVELVLHVTRSKEKDDDEETIFKGFMIEALDVDADDFVSIDRQAIRAAQGKGKKRARSESVPAEGAETNGEDAQDDLLPPLHRLRIAASDAADQTEDKASPAAPTKLSFTILLDKANPLGEPKWVRTGQVDEWIAQAGGRRKDEGGWRDKIHVMDPEPPPTFQHALDTWVESSQLEVSRDELRKFAASTMQQPENVIEVLLRIIRGDARQDRPSHVMPPIQPPAVAKMARDLKAPYPTHQTHVSLATYQLYKMAVESSGPSGSASRKAADKRVGEIVRALPYHLVFRVLDSMAKEALRL